MLRKRFQFDQSRQGNSNLIVIGIVSTLLVLWLSGSFWFEAYHLRKDAVRLAQGISFEHSLFELSDSLADERAGLFSPTGSLSQASLKLNIDELIEQLNSLDTGNSLLTDTLRNRIKLLSQRYAQLNRESNGLDAGIDAAGQALPSEGINDSTFENKLVLFQRYSNLLAELETILSSGQSIFQPRRNDSHVVAARNLKSHVWSLKADAVEIDSLLDREIRLREMITEKVIAERSNAVAEMALGEIWQRYQKIDTTILRLDNDAHLLDVNDTVKEKLSQLADWHINRYRPAISSVLSPSIATVPINSPQQEWAQVCTERAANYEKLWSEISVNYQAVADSLMAKANRYLVIDTFLLMFSLVMGFRLFAAIRRIKYQADHDELTRLPNRRKFSELLNDEIALSDAGDHKLALVVMDLNKFEIINDTLGHAVGDGVLKTIAFRLLKFKNEAVSPARFGGDEFTAAVKCKDAREAMEIAQQLRELVKKEIELDGRLFDVDAYVGLAIYPDHAPNAAELKKAADFAMLHAKTHEQCDIGLYNAEMEAGLKYRLEIESELLTAIEENQLELHYQPQFDVKKQQANRLEALVRWQHPQRGFMPPDRFLSIAEHSGHMPLLGNWVMQDAIRQAAIWNRKLPVIVAVNVAANQFTQAGFVATILQYLDQYQLKPQQLEVEITESLVLQDLDQVTRVLNELRDNAIKIAMDDFGTGYSSLSQLHTLPLDSLKIDRAFVSRLDCEENSSKAVTSTIINMAKHYGLEIVAEGAETIEQVNMLHEMEVDLIQGYYYSKPVAAADVMATLSTINKDAGLSEAA